MQYTISDYASSMELFVNEFSNEFDNAFEELSTSTIDIYNMSDTEFSEAVDTFLQSVDQAYIKSMDTVLSSESVVNSPAATSLWEDFKKSSWCPPVAGAALGDSLCDREKLQQWKDNYAFPIIKSETGELVKGSYILVPGKNNWPLPGWPDIIIGTITGAYKKLFNLVKSAINYILPPDPLVLDLDGDGIETIAVSAANAVMYDYNGNEIKTNTGWVSPDDGFLVFDRDNNGIIDDASELFSDYTLLYAGGRAADGFAALAQEDTNKDGIVNNLDANWNNLKIWQDINSDGISQSEGL